MPFFCSSQTASAVALIFSTCWLMLSGLRGCFLYPVHNCIRTWFHHLYFSLRGQRNCSVFISNYCFACSLLQSREFGRNCVSYVMFLWLGRCVQTFGFERLRFPLNRPRVGSFFNRGSPVGVRPVSCGPFAFARC